MSHTKQFFHMTNRKSNQFFFFILLQIYPHFMKLQLIFFFWPNYVAEYILYTAENDLYQRFNLWNVTHSYYIIDGYRIIVCVAWTTLDNTEYICFKFSAKLGLADTHTSKDILIKFRFEINKKLIIWVKIFFLNRLHIWFLAI